MFGAMQQRLKYYIHEALKTMHKHSQYKQSISKIREGEIHALDL